MANQESEPGRPTSQELTTYEALPFAVRRAIRLALGESALSALVGEITFDGQNIMYINGKPLSTIPPSEF